ncbi:MAG: DUF3147 family protein [Verrucomicrobiota bacterium]
MNPLLFFLTKVIISALVVAVVSEVAKKSGLLGALIASIPLTSLLAIIWLYLDTGNTKQIASLATGILWLILPSCLFFFALPLLLRSGLNFWISLFISCATTALAYAFTLWILQKLERV